MIKIYFKTHGCSTNFSETEAMKGMLKEAQFETVNKPEDAGVIIINVCTVKGETTALKSIRDTVHAFPSKLFVFAGCLTPELVTEIRKVKEDCSLINTNNLKEIVSVVEETVNDNPIEAVSESDAGVKIGLPKVRENKVVGIVPILSGCNNKCSYCSVRIIKGKLCSYPREQVIEEVRASLNNGCKEIWVTSQDNAAYGLEKGGRDLLGLLDEIFKIDKPFMLRLGMMNPSNVLPIADELINIYNNNKKMYRFLHVPVQSGNDDILKLMNRKYSVDDFRQIINKFRKVMPSITISTDIICGFPTETDEQFKGSLNLIKEIRPDVLNISRFQPRPGTEAAKMKQLSGDVIKNRSRVLTEVFTNISVMQNERWLDWTGTILIDEEGKEGTMIGRNFAYKPVVIEGKYELGETVKVRIKKVTPFDLRAIRIE